MQTVEVAKPKVDEYVETIAARERAGRRRANKVIVCGVRWYESVRVAHSAGDLPAKLPACANGKK